MTRALRLRRGVLRAGGANTAAMDGRAPRHVIRRTRWSPRDGEESRSIVRRSSFREVGHGSRPAERLQRDRKVLAEPNSMIRSARGVGAGDGGEMAAPAGAWRARTRRRARRDGRGRKPARPNFPTAFPPPPTPTKNSNPEARGGGCGSGIQRSPEGGRARRTAVDLGSARRRDAAGRSAAVAHPAPSRAHGYAGETRARGRIGSRQHDGAVERVAGRREPAPSGRSSTRDEGEGDGCADLRGRVDGDARLGARMSMSPRGLARLQAREEGMGEDASRSTRGKVEGFVRDHVPATGKV